MQLPLAADHLASVLFLLNVTNIYNDGHYFLLQSILFISMLFNVFKLTLGLFGKIVSCGYILEKSYRAAYSFFIVLVLLPIAAIKYPNKRILKCFIWL